VPRGRREAGCSPGGEPGMTRLILLDADRAGGSMTPEPRFPAEMIASLRAGGGAVIFPTDTLYGLGVDPCSETGLNRLLAVKGRDRGKPIPLLLSEVEQVNRWARHVPPAAARLMDRFWPGALTLVLPAEPGVHPAVTGGGDTVGLRLPDHPVPRALASLLSGAVTGTSANRSGIPGAWGSAEEIVREFTGAVDWILWGGVADDDARRGGAGSSPGSTVVRMTDDRPVLLREGVLPFRHIIEFLQKG
ncbi:MAG TPA: L-threonylcarbamoyladenylate synthase, partial [Candidatus Deferrimicrobium sp.]